VSHASTSHLPEGDGTAAPTFRLLVVCTGNVCRSPAAERLLAAELGPSVDVGSAGTHALRGEPMTAPMARLVEEAGCSAAGFRARQLTEELVRSASLVLTATREHRSAVVELVPAAVRRTFTLREFARLLSGADVSTVCQESTARRLASAVPLALAQRGKRPAAAVDDAVVDPFGASDPVYADSFRSIQAAVAGISRAVGDRSGVVGVSTPRLRPPPR
jgi:protein-tyrosine phosphatase